MALPTPNLDDRTFQDIVREARSRIPLYCPSWTDYNLSDPGITLIEMFAWMVEMLLYRINQVPEKNYIKFMELIGIQLEPPKPAIAGVTFRLSAAQPAPVVIPLGTQVSTIQTEFQDAIVFTTTRDLTIPVPTLSSALVTPDNNSFEDIMPELRNPGIQTAVFQETPQENNALYLGYSEELASLKLALRIQSTIEGIGVDPRDPPAVWEYWDGEQERWSPVRMESDTTGGLNTNGSVVMDIPVSGAMSEVDGKHASWIRCRAVQPRPGQSAYNSSPKIISIISESIGGTVSAGHAVRITGEELGRSNGTPGQKFQLLNVPVLELGPGETLEVETETDGEFEPWLEVADFAASGPDDLHFTCDSASGEIRLGPSIRYPSGEERQHGRVIPDGRRLRFSSYRSGGGAGGNVGERTISVLKSSIPYVDSVINLEAAGGGTDAETLESAKIRAPQVLKANVRAVTTQDYEFLALEASAGIARARCISSWDAADSGLPPGTVRLFLVPALPDSEGFIPLEELELPVSVREKAREYLDERRLLATHLEIYSPEYLPVAVEVQVRAERGSLHELVAAEIEKRLYRYINPISGGIEGTGWPFGRSLSVSEVSAALQGTPGVDYIEEVRLYPVDRDTGERQDSVHRISVPPHGLVCSHRHEVTFAE